MKITEKSDCPICGDDLYDIETHHPADRQIACNGCNATWSDGKQPERDKQCE